MFIEREAEMLLRGFSGFKEYSSRGNGNDRGNRKRNGNGNGRPEYMSLRQIQGLLYRQMLNKKDVDAIHDMFCIRTPEAGIDLKCGVKVEPGEVRFFNRNNGLPVAIADTGKNIATVCYDNLSMPEICEVESRLGKVYHLDKKYFGTA